MNISHRFFVDRTILAGNHLRGSSSQSFKWFRYGGEEQQSDKQYDERGNHAKSLNQASKESENPQRSDEHDEAETHDERGYKAVDFLVGKIVYALIFGS